MKFNALPVKIGLCCSFLAFLAFVPKPDDPIDKIVANLQKWSDVNPQEKVYLHMDKPYYALGDTIWFKGYVTVGSRHQLSAVSKALYVDLITDKDSLVRTLKLPITTGMVLGDFEIDDELKEGNYRIRAYTQWMRNAGEEYFFDKTFTVGSVYSNNIVAKADYKYNNSALMASINYTDDNGKSLSGKDVQYEVVINKKRLSVRSGTTDAQGNLLVPVPTDSKLNMSGAYIRTILTGDDKKKIVRDFPIKALSQGDVQFFPESGSLVSGITSRVAFKAIGVDGLGTNVKGNIVDESNNQVAELETMHAGMGYFMLKPLAGKVYSAKISFADGSSKSFPLPKAANDGYVMSVFQPNKDSILLRINASEGRLAAAQQSPLNVNLIAQSGGETIFASPVKIVRAMTSIWLETKQFPTGIAQFTLFNNTGEPINERIAFVKSNDEMRLKLESEKTSFKSREKVAITLSAKGASGSAVPGNFSVAVIDEGKVPIDEASETTIFSNLLLTSDLKGYIEKPNFYFTKESDETNTALDVLMLTQGYRRFTWKQVADATTSKPEFTPEDLYITISGKVMNLTGGKPTANANVMLMSLKGNINKIETTDAEGRFKFTKIFIKDSIKFTVQGRTAKNSDKVQVILDTIGKVKLHFNPNLADVNNNISGTLKAYLENGRKQDEFFEKTGQIDRVQRLREVRVTASKKNDTKIAAQGMYTIPVGSSDKTITFDPSEVCATLVMCLRAKVQGVRFETELGYTKIVDNKNGRMTLFMNGRKVESEDEIAEILDGSVLPEDVARVEVVRANQALVNRLGGPSLMIITKNLYNRKMFNPSIANIAPKGFNSARTFYSPKYDVPNASKFPDFRSTVYWNPDVKTNTDGKVTLNYFNADGPGAYKVIVEGINAAGELGRQVYRYTVQ